MSLTKRYLAFGFYKLIVFIKKDSSGNFQDVSLLHQKEDKLKYQPTPPSPHLVFPALSPQSHNKNLNIAIKKKT